MLEESVGDHRHQGVTMKTLPGSSLEVIETELFFQLLMRLLANPSRFDDGSQSAQARFGRQVAEIILHRCGGPSATRTRTAAKRAFNAPLVPCRQLTDRHLAAASISSADLDRVSGICR